MTPEYFVRYLKDPEQALRDLEQKTSFHAYVEFRDRAKAEDFAARSGQWVRMFDESDKPGLRKFPVMLCSDGLYRLQMPALCGLGVYDSIEDAEADAYEHRGYSIHLFMFAGIFTGRAVGVIREGELFEPYSLVKMLDLRPVVPAAETEALRAASEPLALFSLWSAAMGELMQGSGNAPIDELAHKIAARAANSVRAVTQEYEQARRNDV